MVVNGPTVVNDNDELTSPRYCFLRFFIIIIVLMVLSLSSGFMWTIINIYFFKATLKLH